MVRPKRHALQPEQSSCVLVVGSVNRAGFNDAARSVHLSRSRSSLDLKSVPLQRARVNVGFVESRLELSLGYEGVGELEDNFMSKQSKYVEAFFTERMDLTGCDLLRLPRHPGADLICLEALWDFFFGGTF